MLLIKSKTNNKKTLRAGNKDDLLLLRCHAAWIELQPTCVCFATNDRCFYSLAAQGIACSGFIAQVPHRGAAATGLGRADVLTGKKFVSFFFFPLFFFRVNPEILVV